ncbi:hypothetical protein LJB86_03100 [Deltaproteobacteria bacterium OttesenSCG-928-M10]|nr:hypothetical protein [Deltaproteobacteria bacterium OttesenSCG-928-M10]
MTSYKDFLKSAALMVENQVAENPNLGVPVDPDVADFMGAFEEEQSILEAIDDDADGGSDGE